MALPLPADHPVADIAHALANPDRPSWLPAPVEARRLIDEAAAEDHAAGESSFSCSHCGCPWPDGEPWCLGCGASNAD